VRIFTLQENIEAARSELASLREDFPKGPSVTASIRFEYELSNYEPAWSLCALHFKESRSEELWRLAFRIRLKIGSYEEARTIIDRAIEAFPTSEAVWLDAVELEVTHKQVSRARARLDKAMQKIPKSEELSLAAIEL
jgi:predicted Zn-dependent protease